MQTISSTIANNILTNQFVYNNAPLMQVVIGGYDVTKAATFTISKDNAGICNQMTITWPNVNYANPLDTGYYNSGRNYTAHNKPSNGYLGLIEPGATVYVKCGYGASLSDTIKVFTGKVDTVKLGLSGSDSIITIICRGMSRCLIDGVINCQYNDGTKFYNMSYDKTTGIYANVVSAYISYGYADPYLHEIWRDVCQRAGFDYGNVIHDTFTAKLSDYDAQSFKEIKGKWYDLANRIAYLLDAHMYEDEEGRINLKKNTDLKYTQTENITLTGTTGVALTCEGYNYRAIPESISISGYTYGDDFVFDYATNKLSRTSDSDIPSGSTVSVSYTFCAWRFKPNQTYAIEQWVSHDELAGRIVATNNEMGWAQYGDLGTLGDGTSVSTSKMEITDHPEILTTAGLDAWIAARIAEMKKNYWNLSVDVVAIPHLRVRDTICVLMWGTVKEIYEIIGYSLSYAPNEGITMSLKCAFYKLSAVV